MKHRGKLKIIFLAVTVLTVVIVIAAPKGTFRKADLQEKLSDGLRWVKNAGHFYVREMEDEIPALPDSLSKVDTILVAWKSKYRMQLFEKGKLKRTYVIGLGQEPLGHKEMQGDNRTPEGDYRIIQKSVGPFEGSVGAYLGTRWMRLNYPNNHDAEQGLEKKLITEKEYKKIIAANNAGLEPPKTTRLGGGIGIHGWYGSWPGEDQQNLTWGCITVQNTELEDLYKRVNTGTRVVIYP